MALPNYFRSILWFADFDRLSLKKDRDVILFQALEKGRMEHLRYLAGGTALAPPLLSIKEIAAAKAYALGRRGNYRDHFDLYVIVKNGHVTLKQIIKIAKKKYGDIFSERMFLEQLLYAGELRVDEQLRYLAEKPASPEKITAFFKAQVAKLRS